jgi:predicted membrane protein
VIECLEDPETSLFVMGAYVFAAVSLICFIVYPLMKIDAKQSTNVFIQQKEYIETHTPKSDIEDAALTCKKIELNQWLYQAQYSQKHYGGWSFYDESIQEFEPIE